MITVKLTTSDIAKEFYEKENLSFSENSNALLSKDREEVLGYCLFDILDDEMVISAIEPKADLMLLDGVLRSTLHIAASRNLAKATYTDKTPKEVFKTLGFLKEDESLNIGKLYESGCKGCGK